MQTSPAWPLRLIHVGVFIVIILALAALLSSLIFIYAVWLFPISWAVTMHGSTTIQDTDQTIITVSWLGCTGVGLLISWYRSLLSPRLVRIVAISLIVGYASIIPWILASILGTSWPYIECGC